MCSWKTCKEYFMFVLKLHTAFKTVLFDGRWQLNLPFYVGVSLQITTTLHDGASGKLITGTMCRVWTSVGCQSGRLGFVPCSPFLFSSKPITNLLQLFTGSLAVGTVGQMMREP